MIKKTDLFFFHEITEDEIRKEILKPDCSKASIRKVCFPDELKAAEVTPIFKKNDNLDKENYRPVRVLPHVLKSFKGSCVSKLKISWKPSYQNCLRVSGKTIKPNMV